MKIFRVVTERDGITTKQPGKVNTEILQSDYRYAAETIQQVWIAINRLLISEEETVVAVVEEHPSIIILTNEQTVSEQQQKINNRVDLELTV